MKFSLVALATFALAAGVQAQDDATLNISAIQSECTSACSPFISHYNDDCLPDFSSTDEATAQKGVDCVCASSTSDLLLDCTGCLSNSTEGKGLVDTWNAACTTSYGNQSAITYVAGTATASSSAADATSTTKDSGSAKQVVAGGLGLLLAGGLALLA